MIELRTELPGYDFSLEVLASIPRAWTERGGVRLSTLAQDMGLDRACLDAVVKVLKRQYPCITVANGLGRGGGRVVYYRRTLRERGEWRAICQTTEVYLEYMDNAEKSLANEPNKPAPDAPAA